MSQGPHVEAFGDRSVAAGTNSGIVSTGDHATIDARTIHLPTEAVRQPANVPAPKATTNLPLPANQDFVDRTDPLARLEATLGETGPRMPQVVHGLGGTGKSALVLQLAHRLRHRFNPVWWLRADSASSITHGLADLAVRLAPHQHVATATSTERAEWALSWLQAHEEWLLVLDDATSPRDLAPLLSVTSGRHVITSRRTSGWRRLAQPLPLDTLPGDAAAELLMRTVELEGPDDEQALTCLADELGNLPLALEQAAAYIESTAISPAAYLDRLRRNPSRMFSALAASGQEADNQRTVARIWQLSLHAISDHQPLAGDLLLLFAWLAPAPLPRDVLEGLHDVLGEAPLAVDEALALLHDYSMITLTRRTVAVHRLVQAVARIPDPADPHRTVQRIAAARERAVGMLVLAMPENPLFNVLGWPRWRELLPHLLALTSHQTSAGEEDLHAAGLLVAASGFLQGDGQASSAVGCAQRSVDIYTRLQGPEHPNTLAASSFLASAHRAAGDLETAMRLNQQSLADHERVYGPDHPDTLIARANLAHVYALQGELVRARDLHRQVLTDMQRLHGPDHPHTVNAHANLASTYREMGDLETAIELHHQAVAGYERAYGPDHSETVTARSNLAYAHQLRGDFAKAIALAERVLTDRERLYGPGHPLTELAHQLLEGTYAARNQHHS